MEKGLKEQLAEETGSRMRDLKGIPAWINMILAAAFSFFYVYTSGFGLISTEVHRGAYLLCTMLLCFMLYPARKGKAGDVNSKEYCYHPDKAKKVAARPFRSGEGACSRKRLQF